jgi:hypothetical protein
MIVNWVSCLDIILSFFTADLGPRSGGVHRVAMDSLRGLPQRRDEHDWEARRRDLIPGGDLQAFYFRLRKKQMA